MNYLIQKGEHSVSVLKIQNWLNQIHAQDPIYHPLKENGIFDEQMKQTIQSFQKKFGLKETGCIDHMTWDKIVLKIKTVKPPEEPLIQPQPSLCYGNQGLDVAKAQEYLNLLQPEHPIEVTGFFDAKTQVKVLRFQNMAGLNPDGRIDLLTWDKMIDMI